VRDPQYCWDVAMNTTNNTCTFSNCKTVLSSDDIGMTPSPVMRCFLTPVFNNKQIVSISAFKMGKSALPEMKITGVYYAYVTYDKDIKEEWQFEAGG
jgi:hypothetical protein